MHIEILQETIVLPAMARGFHLITPIIESHSLIKKCHIGTALLFIMHTSASLSINENSDPSVRKDFESFTNALVPENFPQFTHTYEGPDDMPAHIKTSIFGPSLTIPIKNYSLMLGTWQGIYFNEHRDRPSRRKMSISVTGSFM